jgi:outer membrane lipoprotein SlyB
MQRLLLWACRRGGTQAMSHRQHKRSETMKRMLSLVAAAAALAATVGCSTPSNDYGGARQVAPVTQSPSAYNARYGQVRSIQTVDRPGGASGAGAVLGAVVGGELGNQVGDGKGRTAATVGGAVAGGVVGNEIEKRRGSGGAQVYRVEVQFDNGSVDSYDFTDLNGLRIGDRVRWEDNQLYRM